MMVRINSPASTPITLSLDATYGILGCTYWPTEGTEDSVTETILVTVEGTEAVIKSAVQYINSLLREAEMAGDTISYPVYLEFQATASASIYRSKIVSGMVQWDSEAVRHKLDNATNTVGISVIVTRLNFWEGPEVEIPISTAAQAESVNGRIVYNNDNASSSNNYFQIAANRVIGDLPAPVKLRIAQYTGSAVSWRSFYVGNNVFSSPSSADVWLLGSEAFTSATATWGAGGITHSTLMFIFNFSNTLMTQTKGRMFRVIAALTSATAGMYFRAGIYSNYGNFFLPLRVNRERYNSDAAGASSFKLLDLGQLPIPPGGYNSAPGGAALVISARCAVAGSATIDFVNLMAADSTKNFNSFLSFEQLGYAVDYTEYVDVDGIDNSGAGYYSGSVKVAGSVKMHTDYLYVWPGKQQRVHVLFDEGYTFTAGRQMSIQLFYRPRVRTVG